MEETITIVNGCRGKSQRYQKMLYERYRGFALKTVFRYVYNYEEAIETTNDGFVKFFLSIEKFRCEIEADIEKILLAWLKRIMINTSIDLLRKKMLLPEIGGIPDYVWDMKDKGNTPDQGLIYKDLVILVKKLPPPLRIVFNMYIIDGYTHIEIADALKIPVGTSKSNLLRAKALIKKYLTQNELLTECRM